MAEWNAKMQTFISKMTDSVVAIRGEIPQSGPGTGKRRP